MSIRVDRRLCKLLFSLKKTFINSEEQLPIGISYQTRCSNLVIIVPHLDRGSPKTFKFSQLRFSWELEQWANLAIIIMDYHAAWPSGGSRILCLGGANGAGI